MDGIPADTTVDAYLKQIEILRRLGPAGRAEVTFRLSNNLHRIAEDGIRLRHPDYDDQKVKLAYLRLTIEPELFKEAFGDIDIQP